MKVLLVLVTIVLIAAVGVDVAAKEIAQDRIADQVEDSIEGVNEVDAAIGGFPFLPALLSGHMDELQLEIPRVRTRGLAVADVELSLEDLEFDPVEAFAGSGEIRVARGGGHAYATAAAVSRGLRRAGVDATVAFRGSDALVTAAGHAQPVETVQIRKGELVFELPTGPVALEIPATLESVRYESARVEDDRLRIEIVLSRNRLQL